jgi:hypothetical protein
MCLNWVSFDGQIIQKWDVNRDESGNVYYGSRITNFYGYKDIDWSNPTMNARKNQYYDMDVIAGAYDLYYEEGSYYGDNADFSGNFPMDIKVYIDFNQDGEFDDSELAGQYDNQGYDYEEYFQIYIPGYAQNGETRMRIICDYYPQYGAFDACNSYYGEAKDYVINIIAGPDAGLAQITSPTNPLMLGVQPVKALLYNYSSSVPLTSCQINWSVDGMGQSTYYWYGYLDPENSEEVTLGDYDFASKGAVTSYSISANTNYPNYTNDDNPYNDAAPNFTAYIPLRPGVYTVGGAKPDFATLSEATDFLNNVGTIGDGDFTFNIRPGTYTGPFTMDNISHGKDNFIFQRDPATSGDVIITAPTNWSNYVWYINNLSNLTFRNLTFGVTNPYNYGGRIMMIRGNADNYTFANNTFNGTNLIDQTPYKFSLIDCQATEMNNHIYSKNIFNLGNMSLVLLNTTRNSNGLLVDGNVFSSFTNRAIDAEGISGAVISNNHLTASSKTTNYGIFVQNGTQIINNTISGILGSGNSGAAISAIHDAVSSPAIINNNTITNCSSIYGVMAYGIDGGEISNNKIAISNSMKNFTVNGIQIVKGNSPVNKVTMAENDISIENGYGIYGVNYLLDILRNKIQTTNTASSNNLEPLYLVSSNGMVLLNEIISNNSAMEIINSNLTFAYNSTIGLSSTETAKIISGNNHLYRNIFVNKGTGPALTMLGADNAVLEGNNYFAAISTIATIGGTNYTTASQLLPFDKDARNNDPMYKTNTNLQVTEFHDELAFNAPLQNFTWPQENEALYEGTTLDGISKNGFYYAGAFIIFPTMELIGYSDELVDCEGTPDRLISVSAATSTDQTPLYQWYKDGLLMQGETAHSLAFNPFDYTVSATYYCSVYCPGFGTLKTGPIPVYALTLPSIVEQPKEVSNAVVGQNYTFSVKAHYRGLIPPYYKDYFQWYKYDAVKKDSVPLTDNSRYAGTTSSDFTIRNLATTDLCKTGDFYFVKIESQCGTVYSDPFVISKTPDVVFRDHPENINPCPGSDVVFTANAIAPESYSVTYKWTKDGLDVTNNSKYNGVNTNKLQVFNVQTADQGNYICVATIPEVPTSKNSNPGILKLKDIPTATAHGDANITTKRDNDVTLLVDLVKGAEPLTVTWYYNGEMIKTALWSQYDGDKALTLLLESVVETQTGEYKCVLENECDKTEVVFNLTVTKWDGTQSVDVINQDGFALYACTPNPNNGSSKIKFEMPETQNTVIKLIDQSGRTVSVLFSGMANKGMNILDVNTTSLNISSGLYYYTITTNGFTASMPMVIVK